MTPGDLENGGFLPGSQDNAFQEALIEGEWKFRLRHRAECLGIGQRNAVWARNAFASHCISSRVEFLGSKRRPAGFRSSR